VSVRITQGMMSRRLLTDLNAASARVDTAQRQIASQKRILKPSDDPIGAQKAVLTRGELNATNQYQANVSQARGWLETTDAALGQVTDLVHRARELTVQGANDATGPTARRNLALEIDQLVSAIKQAANTSYGGVYVFGGTDTTSPPYDTNSSPPTDVYTGDDNLIAREIGPAISVQINTLIDAGASPLLGSGQATAGPPAAPGDDGLLRTLRDISAHLKGATVADADALRGPDLRALETNLDRLNDARAQVGATVNRLDAADARLGATTDAANQLLSETEDVDFAQATLTLSTQQTVYEAALRSGAAIIQPSLLDFLR
jgi:flagellar hook-associated protein 3 FlgL